MRTVKVSGKVLRMYDSIDELPIRNFQKYNKFLLIDSGIGSDADDIDAHIVKIAKFIKIDKAKAYAELHNLRNSLFMVANEISPKHLAFVSLIHSIDGKEVTDLSDDNLNSILASINTIKHSTLVELLLKIKKKVDSELLLYFPSNFINNREKEAYDKLKARTQLVLEGIVTGEDNTEDIGKIDDYLLNMHAPQTFEGEKSVEIKYDKQFNTLCINITQQLGLNTESMTVLQFYNAVETMKNQAEAKLKASRRH